MQAKRPRAQAWSGWMAGRRRTVLDPWGLAICGLVLATIPLAVHALKYPDFASFWTGIDQQRYLDSAHAWSQADLSPERHHYLPLYPLLGAMFVWLTPWQPFMAPDVLCLVASLLLFVRIGRRLAPGWPDSALAVCFLVASLGGRVLVAIWVVPWSTTGSAPCQFGALLLALRFGERPSAGRAFALGAGLGLTAGFRPGDCAALSLCCGLFAGTALLRANSPAGRWLGTVGAGLLGLALGLLPTLAAHLAVFGLHEGAYLRKSAGIGLEWRLLPLRWVMLVTDPRPLLPEGRGMAEVLPWVLPGIAGLLLGLTPRTGHRVSPMALAGSAVALHWAIYLAYRDLQPYGLWRFYNVHYFKWTFPFLVLWAAQLGVGFACEHLRSRAALALAVAVISLCWRPVPAHKTAFAIDASGRDVVLPPRFGAVDQVVWLPLRGDWTALYFGKSVIRTGSEVLANTSDFKMAPLPSGALLMPLRPFAGPGTLNLASGVRLRPGAPGWLADVFLSFGLPCGLPRACPDSTDDLAGVELLAGSSRPGAQHR